MQIFSIVGNLHGVSGPGVVYVCGRDAGMVKGEMRGIFQCAVC